MENLLIVTLVLVSVLIVAVSILIYLYFKSNKNCNKDVDTKSIELKISESLNTLIEKNNSKLFEINETLNSKFQDHSKELNSFKESSTKSIQDSYIQLLNVVQSRLDKMDQKIDEKIGEGFKNNSESLEKVNKALGLISSAQKNLDNLNVEVATLNNVLSNNQARGRFGEIALESILAQVFGETRGLYETQYSINPNVRPDAVIFLPEPEKLLCIDSKFSFTNYEKLFDHVNDSETKELMATFRSELKEQIKKIASSYIIKDQTCQYAIMFIPSDAIYTFIQTDDKLYDQVVRFAIDKKVVITSPSTLQPILANLRMLQVNYEITKNIDLVIKQIMGLKVESERFKGRFDDLSNAIDKLQDKKKDLSITVNKIVSKTSDIINDASKNNLINENQEN